MNGIYLRGEIYYAELENCIGSDGHPAGADHTERYGE